MPTAHSPSDVFIAVQMEARRGSAFCSPMRTAALHSSKWIPKIPIFFLPECGPLRFTLGAERAAGPAVVFLNRQTVALRGKNSAAMDSRRAQLERWWLPL